jgi:uncharacterized membrane protein
MSEPTVPPPPPQYTPPPPPPPAGPSGASPNRGIMIVLSYIWLLNLIPLLVEKDDREVQWHAKHGIVLMVAEWIVLIVWGMFRFALFMVHLGFIGCLLSLVSFALWIGFLILHIMCIVKGLNGERLLVPGVSQFADRF